MRGLSLVLVLASAFVGAGCWFRGDLPGRQATEAGCMQPVLSEKMIRGDNYTIRDFRQVDNCLRLTLEHGGGCGEHSYELRLSEVVARRSETAVFYEAVVYHDDNGDNCKALLRTAAKFDMTSFFDGCDDIWLELKGYDGTIRISR